MKDVAELAIVGAQNNVATGVKRRQSLFVQLTGGALATISGFLPPVGGGTAELTVYSPDLLVLLNASGLSSPTSQIANGPGPLISLGCFRLVYSPTSQLWICANAF